MNKKELEVPVLLEFRAMSRPIEVAVPHYTYRYLNAFADRRVSNDGKTVYSHPDDVDMLPELRVIPVRQKQSILAA